MKESIIKVIPTSKNIVSESLSSTEINFSLTIFALNLFDSKSYKVHSQN